MIKIIFMMPAFVFHSIFVASQSLCLKELYWSTKKQMPHSSAWQA